MKPDDPLTTREWFASIAALLIALAAIVYVWRSRDGHPVEAMDRPPTPSRTPSADQQGAGSAAHRVSALAAAPSVQLPAVDPVRTEGSRWKPVAIPAVSAAVATRHKESSLVRMKRCCEHFQTQAQHAGATTQKAYRQMATGCQRASGMLGSGSSEPSEDLAEIMLDAINDAASQAKLGVCEEPR